ncbi:OmpH family outer membrane protein [Aerophototrophica crusticola]|uniref:OmpH family outer membrane protein n=1 Tax=Aerophototrophica crusticola TaxID=1709002 RepID=A0A858R5V3_9PROT|nr:OmpH family outer membrane protein [Rhodospirillaceae bacterium B3]
MVVVDVQRLLQQSLANQSIQRQLASQREILQREMAAQYEQQRQAEQELARLRPSLQPDEFDRKRIEFGNEVTATSRVTQEKTRKLDAAFLQARTTMLETIRVVIGEIAAERGATLVISSEFVFYQANDSLDITDTALQRLNTRLPEVKVNLPQ